MSKIGVEISIIRELDRVKILMNTFLGPGVGDCFLIQWFVDHGHQSRVDAARVMVDQSWELLETVLGSSVIRMLGE